MSQRIKRAAATITALGVIASSGVAMASAASAAFYGNTVSYGFIRSDSSCNKITAGYCSIRFTNNSEVARPSAYGGVKNCGRWGIPDGTLITEAIASQKLVNRNVGVLYGGSGAQGALNCH